MSSPRASQRRRLAITLLSLAVVLAIFAAQLERKSPPGPLAATHARVPGLEAVSACSRCHGSLGGSLAEACLGCHREIAEQLLDGRGLHGGLADGLARDCGACHAEHHGEALPLVTESSFRRAGFEGRASFAHERVGFALEGRHAALDCSACHPAADLEWLPAGTPRFLGQRSACVACHADPHAGSLSSSCADCHDPSGPFARIRPESHDALRLDGAHSGLDCRSCHQRDSDWALEVVVSGEASGARTCIGCHAAPHARAFLDAAEAAGESCASCHPAERGGFASAARAPDARLHALAGFPLEGAHAALDCQACHAQRLGGRELAFSERFPGREPGACARCHADAHPGESEDGPFASGSCADCHGTSSFAPADFGLAEHARTAFLLDGAHAALACTACHARGSADQPPTFEQARGDCEACHADVHGFDARARELGIEEPGGCARCHSTTRFDELLEGTFDHERWTGFPLRGAHEQAACASCHASDTQADTAGGWLDRIDGARAGVAADCAGCHSDPHGGILDTPPEAARDAPEEDAAAARSGCARCHTESAWSAAAARFDHGTSTGFVLEGRHAQLECAACHASSEDQDGVRTRWLLPRAATCSDCHREPHVGQLAREGVTACAACHTDSEDWGARGFDHGRDSRFVLDGIHSRLGCAACHRPWPLPGGGEAVRYVPLGTSCGDCHGTRGGARR